MCTPCNTCFLRPTRVHNPNGPYTLQWVPFFPKIAPSHSGTWAPSNAWFLGLTESSIQTTSWSVQPFLQGSLHYCDRQTDRLTDHATQSTETDRIYICSTAMQPNNNSKTFSLVALNSSAWQTHLMQCTVYIHWMRFKQTQQQPYRVLTKVKIAQPQSTDYKENVLHIWRSAIEKMSMTHCQRITYTEQQMLQNNKTHKPG